MTDLTLMHSRQAGRIPVWFQGVELWRRRVLAWIYPSRGWGSAPQPAPAGGQSKIKPTPGKPVGFRTGAAK